jgi:hypothetical protein
VDVVADPLAARTGSRPHLQVAAYLLPVVFLLVVASVLWRHEMWMDELNAWLIARDAHDLRTLFANMHGESHPPLWYAVLYVVTRFTTDPRAMQLVHLLIALAVIAVIAIGSPFRVAERWLLSFGYLFVYEFAVISRGYAAGVLLALIVCALYAKAQPRPLGTAVLLALLANTSAYGMILALAITMGIIADGRMRLTPKAIGALAIVFGATIVAVLFIVPARDVIFGREWNSPWTLRRAEYMFDATWAAYVPVPDPRSSTPWNSNVLLGDWRPSGSAPSMAAAVLGLGMLLTGVYALRRQRGALVTYVTGSVLMLGLIGFKYSGGMRHHGHLFVLLIVALWMAERTRHDTPTRVPLIALLVAHVAAGAFFLVADFREPFSVSKEVAAYVRTLPPSTAVVVAHTPPVSYITPELSGYLRRPVNVALKHRVVRSSFSVFDIEHYDNVTEQDLLTVLDTFSAERRTDVAVIVDNWQPRRLGTPIARFSRHLLRDEGEIDVYLRRRSE